MEQASTDKGWDLPLGTITSIWREGCIIRSQFLDLITASFRKNRGKGNLLLAKDYTVKMKDNQQSLRKTIFDAAIIGLPVRVFPLPLAILTVIGRHVEPRTSFKGNVIFWRS